VWGGRCWERTLLGSIVQKGKFSAGMEHLVNTWRGPKDRRPSDRCQGKQVFECQQRTLKSVDLPTLGMPQMPAQARHGESVDRRRQRQTEDESETRTDLQV
jgi:hypothetical protein